MARRPLALLAASLAVLSPTLGVAQSSPRMVRLSYPSIDASRQMGITWNSDSATPQVVQYGAASTAEHEVTAVVSSPLAGGLGYVHSAVLNDLTPATQYRYRVGSAADGFAPQNGSFAFTTGPQDPCAPFVFDMVGDVRGLSYLSWLPNSGSSWPMVFDRLAEDNPDFLLIPGDLVYSGDNLDEWNEFFNQGVDHYPFLPVMPSFGNHDRGGSGANHNYELLYTLPQNPSGREEYYAFRYGNALFIAFNTEDGQAGDDFATQGAWVEKILQDNPATWKVLFFHHPVWTTTPGETALGCIICGHPPNELGQNPVLIDLIDRYDVDLVIASHNHFYERSKPLKGGGSEPSMVEEAPSFRGTVAGTRDASGRVPTWGSLYMVTGGGGATLVPLSYLDGLGQVWAAGEASRNDKFHHVRVNISDLSLTLTAVDSQTGATLDSVNLTKLPQYRVSACTPAAPTDNDDDGYPSNIDCNDQNPDIRPGAAELCGDGIDQDCTGGDQLCLEHDSGPTPGDPGVAPGGDADTGTRATDDGCGCRGAAGGWSLLTALPLLRRRRVAS
ncbi:MAG: metallophosphoesterase [Deltaproteobacteria bacterium]|nr:metallophosphoesterase [Deltaproteobacteria bacterium]